MNTTAEPFLSVGGLRKDHAVRAIRWLRNRSIAAGYRAQDKAIICLEIKDGRERTYEAMHQAIDATRRWS